MKNTILFLLLILGTFTTQSQVLVKMSPRAEMPKTTAAKPKPAKTKIVYVDRPVTTTDAIPKTAIKFVCDTNAILFIDGEKKGILKMDTPFRINLSQGEYIVKVVNPKDENDFLKWNYTVSEIGIEKLEEIKFKKAPGENKQPQKKDLVKNTTIKKKPIKTDLEEAHLLGKIKSMTTNTYMGLGTLINYSRKGNLIATTSVFYDEKGYKKETIFSQQKTIINRDINGNIISSQVTSTNESSGNLISKTTYDYDNNDNFIGYNSYSADGKLTSHSILKRDAKGLLLENKSYDANNNLISTAIYDEKEHIKETYAFGNGGAETVKILYSWDENNNNTYREIYQLGKLLTKTTSIFDNRNHVVETSTLMPTISKKGIVAKFFNKYDNFGNLIKTHGDGTIVEIVIEYY